jgi:hypothetical protein
MFRRFMVFIDGTEAHTIEASSIYSARTAARWAHSGSSAIEVLNYNPSTKASMPNLPNQPKSASGSK